MKFKKIMKGLTVKKFVLLSLLIVLMVGCSKVDRRTKEVPKKEEPIVFKFDGMKLQIENHTNEDIMILDSETEYSIKKDGKWELVDSIHGDLMLTSSVLSKEKSELNLAIKLSEIQSNEIKVTVYYSNGHDSDEYEAKSIIYNKKGE